MSETLLQDETRATPGLPLCVDLDGTLVKTDTFFESFLLLVRMRPLSALRAPLWLRRGKAALKREVTSRAVLDVTRLPYNQALLTYLRAEKARGRRIYLATGADSELAVRVAGHLGIFEGVLGSDGATNLTGDNKLQALRRQFGGNAYDYIGNSHADVELLHHAHSAMIANPAPLLGMRLRARKVTTDRRFHDGAGFIRTFPKAIRIHQWAKNLLIFLPLLLAHDLRLKVIATAAVAFLCFSLCASAAYIFNDILDIESDRKHPHKRLRAFASGDISILGGIFIGSAFLAGGIAGAFTFLTLRFFLWLLLYLATTLSYSLYLKQVALVDVIILAGLYTVRVLAGGAATHITISPWLSAFSVFFFLSLAMVKRFSELQNGLARGAKVAHGRGYLSIDIEPLRSFGTASAYASVVVFALYLNGSEVTAMYTHPNRMWLITPMLLLWLSRIWLLASRSKLNEDPVIFAVTDRLSLLIGLAIACIAALATF